MSLTYEDLKRLRAWMKANPMQALLTSSSESESDSDEWYAPPGAYSLLIGQRHPKWPPPRGWAERQRIRRIRAERARMKLYPGEPVITLGQRNDASPPESEPTPEPSGEPVLGASLFPCRTTIYGSGQGMTNYLAGVVKAIKLEPQSDHDDEPLRKVIKLTFEQTDENLLRLRKWINSDPISESDCSDDEEPVLGGLVPSHITVYGPSGQPMTNITKRLIEMIGQQSDASPPESEPTPEPSGEAEQEQQAPPPEYIVPPQAPKLLRSRRRLPAGQPHQ